MNMHRAREVRIKKTMDKKFVIVLKLADLHMFDGIFNKTYNIPYIKAPQNNKCNLQVQLIRS